ncbi:hypothetical protein F5050DRAFT_1745307 [Lentinula boryana]|uniref:Uncharacterized protein n=1 Tax=Lentinula boryana TaxID=40481 RepID=A0ABQ8QIK1_9AGAR|nr:hypothetical protein F5050DRAFT_1745307 [Lentinula boryana]
MLPLTKPMVKMITDAGSAIVAVVDSLPLSNDAALQSWARNFAVALSRYREVVRILTEKRNKESYIEPVQVKDALITADDFLLENTHWTWDDKWLDPRWRRAALERKEIWEAEEARRRRLKEEEEENNALVAQAQAFLSTEIVVFDYPTEEEWAALRNEHPLQEDPSLDFDPSVDIPHESDSSIGSSLLSFSETGDTGSPSPSAHTLAKSPKTAAGNIDAIWDDEVQEVPQIRSSSSQTSPVSQLYGKPREPRGQIGTASRGPGTTEYHVRSAKAVDGAGTFSKSNFNSSTSAGVVTRPPVRRASLPTTKRCRLNKTSSNSETNNWPTNSNAKPSASHTPEQPPPFRVTTSIKRSQLDYVRMQPPAPPSTTRRTKRTHADADEDTETDEDRETRYVRCEGGDLIGMGHKNCKSPFFPPIFLFLLFLCHTMGDDLIRFCFVLYSSSLFVLFQSKIKMFPFKRQDLLCSLLPGASRVPICEATDEEAEDKQQHCCVKWVYNNGV